MIAYLIALMALAVPMLIFAKGPLDHCAAFIISNWLLGFGYNEIMDTYTPWGWLLAIDTACAVLMILYRRGARWPLLIAASYLPMILCHFRYAYADGRWSQHQYWDALLLFAWVQLGLLALWGGSRLVTALFARPVFRPSGRHHHFNREGIKP